jgi:prepilin-type N-terminal cleavage/methylation domain-containing protein
MKSPSTSKVSSSSLSSRMASGGFTLIEVMIAMSIMMFVLGIFSYLQLASLRQTRLQEVYIRSHSDAARALDKMRPILLCARFNSIVVDDGGRRIRFNDPWLGETIISELQYNPTEQTLFYRRDVDGAPARPLLPFPFQEVRFELLESGSLIRLILATAAEYRGVNRPFVIDTTFRVRSFS